MFNNDGTNGSSEYHTYDHNINLDLYDVDLLYCAHETIPPGYQLIYVHPTRIGSASGFYYMVTTEGMDKLLCCPQHPIGALNVWYRTKMFCMMHNTRDVDFVSCVQTKNMANLAYDNFLDDQNSWEKYGCSYEEHMIDIIDGLFDECTKPTPGKADSCKNDGV